MKCIPSVLLCFIVFVAPTALVQEAAAMEKSPVPSHCAPAEEVIFSCALQEGGAVVSLCASPDRSWLQYRSGAPGSVEVAYPKENGKSLQAYSLEWYTRFRFSFEVLSFQMDDATYKVTSSFEGDNGPEILFHGVEIVDQSGSERTLACGEAVVSRLRELEHVVPSQNAVGQ